MRIRIIGKINEEPETRERIHSFIYFLSITTLHNKNAASFTEHKLMEIISMNNRKKQKKKRKFTDFHNH
jgi:hypothetical protein